MRSRASGCWRARRATAARPPPPPDHASCIKISTDGSLREMILPVPGALVILSPIIFGILCGVNSA